MCHKIQAYTPLIKNPEDIRCDTAVTLDLSPKIKNRHGMDEELKNECSEQNKVSRLRLFLRNKGFESIIQLLFGPGSFCFTLHPQTHSLTFSVLVGALGD